MPPSQPLIRPLLTQSAPSPARGEGRSEARRRLLNKKGRREGRPQILQNPNNRLRVLGLRRQNLTAAIHARLQVDVVGAAQFARILVLDIGRGGECVSGTAHAATRRRSFSSRNSHDRLLRATAGSTEPHRPHPLIWRGQYNETAPLASASPKVQRKQAVRAPKRRLAGSIQGLDGFEPVGQSGKPFR